MTQAEQFREEGRRESQQEGKMERVLRTLKRSVMGTLEIWDGAVPRELAARVQGMKTQSTLEQLLKPAICSCSLADFEKQRPHGSLHS
jgi:hypothetical protein